MKKKYVRLFSIAVMALAICAGCNKEMPEPIPTLAPTSTPALTPATTPKYDGIPTLSRVAEESLAQGKDYTGDALYARGVNALHEFWGQPDGMLSGFWGDIWNLDDNRMLIIYYNAEGIVHEFKITERQSTDTTTPVPTAQPKDEPTPTKVPATLTPAPTDAPVEVDAPFTMVSPVPQSEIADIVGTMTVDTYPDVDGSTATLPLSEAVFMAATGESAEVAASEIVHTKTTNSYNRLYNGEVDLLIVYEPAESIVERMKKEPLCIKPIGLDALVFMANQANSVESLTMEQLISIYSGAITNWSEVGGPDKELLAFQRPENSGSQTLMQKLVMGDVEMVTGDNVYRYYTMSDVLEGMLSYNGEDNTLGYSVFYYANNMYFEKDLKFMAVDGVLPSTRTIYDGSYQLTNAFYAVIRTDEPEDSNARKIFDWLTGEAGQQLVLDLGYVPVQMPEGAEISDAQVQQIEKVEILATEPLEEGQYFVFFNPQNMDSGCYYGDMTVYNSAWEEIANFYNVAEINDVLGIYTHRYLPVGQIRQNEEGNQVLRYGFFDLEEGEYEVYPTYSDLIVLDADREYYAVPNPEEGMDYKIVNGKDETLLPDVSMSDWLEISPFGNGYREFFYDYENRDNGYTYRFYDENLQLKKVYCEKETALPPVEERINGVEYYNYDGEGCLVDENGELLISKELFLKKYGNGEDTECELTFYSVTLEEGSSCYGIYYQGKVYLVDRNLELIRILEDLDVGNRFSSSSFYPNYMHYYKAGLSEFVDRTYDGEPVTMQDGSLPDRIDRVWNSEGYVLYRRDGNRYLAEEYTEDGQCISYEFPLPSAVVGASLNYLGNHSIVINFDSGETMQTTSSGTQTESTIWKSSLFYKGTPICAKSGLSEAISILEDGAMLWAIRTGEAREVETDSLYEDANNISQYDYALFHEEELVYEMDSALRIMQGKNVILFLKGNYLYAVGLDGTEYMKALHTFMSND